MQEKDDEEGAEVKIAKVAITNVLIWVAAWTPYAAVAMIGCFGNKLLVFFLKKVMKEDTHSFFM